MKLVQYIRVAQCTVLGKYSITDTLILFADPSGLLCEVGLDLDKRSGGLVSQVISDSNNYSGKLFDILHIPGKFELELGKGTGEVHNLIILGLGEDKLSKVNILELGGMIATKLNALKFATGCIIPGPRLTKVNEVMSLSEGVKLKAYAFNGYFVDKEEDHKLYVKGVNILYTNHDMEMPEVNALVEGVILARDLVSMPPNVLYPASFANLCRGLTDKDHRFKVKVLGEEQMKKLGMNALLAVGAGSEKESKLVILEWHGGKKSDPYITFVGKGVTFDTGGINLKPSHGLADMKYDMAGAAAVVGAMKSVHERRPKKNVVGIIGLVENMCSGSAQRPSDVVVSMSGQTIEVDNTDAEGRLVLADVLHYAQTKYKVEFIIDLATLTGAVIVALGEGVYAGVFSNSQYHIDRITYAGKFVGEEVWHMPLSEEYDKQINSDIADVKNTGSGRGAGASTAAHFLQRFIQEGVVWAHIDIAGMAWSKKETRICPKGATGFGVRLLHAIVVKEAEFIKDDSSYC